MFKNQTRSILNPIFKPSDTISSIVLAFFLKLSIYQGYKAKYNARGVFLRNIL